MVNTEFLDGAVSYLMGKHWHTSMQASQNAWKEITRKSDTEILLYFTYLDRSRWFGQRPGSCRQLIQCYSLRSTGSLHSLRVNISCSGGSKSRWIGFLSNSRSPHHRQSLSLIAKWPPTLPVPNSQKISPHQDLNSRTPKSDISHGNKYATYQGIRIVKKLHSSPIHKKKWQ